MACGGIPVVFPQFAELGPLPLHGFAHEAEWQCIAADGAQASFELTDTPATHRVWPHKFAATLAIVLMKQSLTLRLTIENRGEQPFSFAAGLHTYLKVGDIFLARLHGLDDAVFEERRAPGVRHRAVDTSLSLADAIDRVYVAHPSELALDDPVLARSIVIGKHGFDDVVVWNPGPETGSNDPFLQPGEYTTMVCVEAAQVIAPIHLQPSRCWTGSQSIEVRV